MMRKTSKLPTQIAIQSRAKGEEYWRPTHKLGTVEVEKDAREIDLIVTQAKVQQEAMKGEYDFRVLLIDRTVIWP